MKLLLLESEFLVSSTNILEKTTLDGFCIYANPLKFIKREQKLFVSTGDKKVSFIVVELGSIPLSMTTGKPLETDKGTVYIETPQSNPGALLVTDDPYNPQTLYSVSMLRVLGFTERISILQEPSTNLTEMFYSAYGIKNSYSLYLNITALCEIIQICLVYFGHLSSQWFDGILCDHTEYAMKQFISTLHKDGSSGTKIWSAQIIKSMISKILIYKKRLAKSGCLVSKDPLVFPDIMQRKIKQYQKQQGLSVTKILDQPTLDKLSSATKKIRVSSVTHTVSNIKNAVGEIAGLKAHKFSDDEEDDVDSSSDNTFSKNTTDINYYIRQIIKRDTEIQEKTTKKEIKKEHKKEREVSKDLIKRDSESQKTNKKPSMPVRVMQGIKVSTSKKLGEIASKGKSVTKGVKHILMHGHSSDSSYDSDVETPMNTFPDPPEMVIDEISLSSGFENEINETDNNNTSQVENSQVENSKEDMSNSKDNVKGNDYIENEDEFSHYSSNPESPIMQQKTAHSSLQTISNNNNPITTNNNNPISTNNNNPITNNNPISTNNNNPITNNNSTLLPKPNPPLSNTNNTKQTELNQLIKSQLNELNKQIQDIELKISMNSKSLIELDSLISPLKTKVNERLIKSKENQQQIEKISLLIKGMSEHVNGIHDDTQKTYYGVGIIQDKFKDFDEYVKGSIDRCVVLDQKMKVDKDVN